MVTVPAIPFVATPLVNKPDLGVAPVGVTANFLTHFLLLSCGLGLNFDLSLEK